MIKNVNIQDIRKKFSIAADQRMRAITAGLSFKEIGALLRGEPPTEKPNPRV